MKENKQCKNNILNRERALLKKYGFEATRADSLARNPYLRLADGTSVIQMAGLLFSRVTTTTFFGTGQYLKQWKSSNGNNPYASMSTTKINETGEGAHTEMYYREIFKEEISLLARRYGCREKDIKIDHINHIRGDNFDSNLRLATAGQNNQNRSKTKVEKAFYTLDEVLSKLSSGEWVRLKTGE